MLIVGFGNRARQGKDVAGTAIVDFYQREAARVKKCYGPRVKSPVAKLYKFADALYQECREIHGMTVKDAPLLQRVGMVRRAEDKDYWVKQVEASIRKDSPDIAVITDVRFHNEAGYIKANGGIVVNVSRLNLDGTPYIADDRPSDHPSETALDDYNFDYYIKAHTGESALVEQLAIAIVQFDLVRRP